MINRNDDPAVQMLVHISTNYVNGRVNIYKTGAKTVGYVDVVKLTEIYRNVFFVQESRIGGGSVSSYKARDKSKVITSEILSFEKPGMNPR